MNMWEETAAKISPEAFFTVSEQTELFLLSVLMGGVFGILFDIFRALRVIVPILKKPLPTAVCDILFFIICGFGIYLFSLLFARGEIRGYYWLGALLGGVIYLLTAGTVVMGIIRTVFGVFYSMLRKIFILISAPFIRLYTQIRTKMHKGFVVNAKKSAPVIKNKEKHLKKQRKILYNKDAKMKKV